MVSNADLAFNIASALFFKPSEALRCSLTSQLNPRPTVMITAAMSMVSRVAEPLSFEVKFIVIHLYQGIYIYPKDKPALLAPIRLRDSNRRWNQIHPVAIKLGIPFKSSLIEIITIKTEFDTLHLFQ